MKTFRKIMAWLLSLAAVCTLHTSASAAGGIGGGGTQTIAVADHIPSDWIVDQAPEVGKGGSKHIECSVCKTLLQTQTIPALDPPSTDPAPTDPAPADPEPTDPAPTVPSTEPEQGPKTSDNSGLGRMLAGAAACLTACALLFLLLKQAKREC